MGLTGCLLVGRGVKYGWLFYAFASAINIFLGVKAGYLGLAAGAIGYFLLELKGYYTAHKLSKQDNREIIHE